MKFSLTPNQFFLIIFLLQSGIVFITFQTRLLEAAGRNAWVIFIFTGVFQYLLLIFYERQHSRFLPGPFVLLLYKLYWIYINVLSLTNILYSLSIWLYPNTPSIVLLLFMVTVSFYANCCKPDTIINLPVIIIPAILLFFVSLLIALPDLEWTWLFPLDLKDVELVWNGFLTSQLTVVGVASFLFLRKRVVTDVKMIGWPIAIYAGFWFLFFFMSLLVVQLFFPIETIAVVPQALLYLLKSQKVNFVERLDLFFLFIWMMWSIITVILFAFLIRLVHAETNSGKQYKFNLLIHAIFLLVPPFFSTRDRLDMIREPLLYLHLFIVVVLPIFVFIKNRRQKT
ncbi:hypothetical protein HNO89_003280 [Sporosarcina luteola]|nr:hypothetical protein [Sporosarcina luteola]